MKLRYFAHIAYNGYRYSGWQNQAAQTTVQGTIEATFARIFGQRVCCHGCGRTDAMVHASSYYFHFDIDQPLGFDLKHRLNKMLPPDITVYAVFPVDRQHNAQHSAISRTYTYHIHTHKNPFIAQYSALYEETLDVEAMRSAVALLPQRSNYANFCLTPRRQDSYIVEIGNAQLFSSSDQTQLRLTITANRFLKGMVRIIAFRLIEIGRGNMSIATFETLLEGNKTHIPAKRAYPQGLWLSEVRYGFIGM